MEHVAPDVAVGLGAGAPRHTPGLAPGHFGERGAERRHQFRRTGRVRLHQHAERVGAADGPYHGRGVVDVAARDQVFEQRKPGIVERQVWRRLGPGGRGRERAGKQDGGCENAEGREHRHRKVRRAVGSRKAWAARRVIRDVRRTTHDYLPPMPDLRIEATRGNLVESVHRVSVAVMNADGRLVAASGDPSRVAYWRSAAKPFQAMPLIADGAADALSITPEELALACASHSGEARHLAVAAGLLRRIGATEDMLACGPHPPASEAEAERLVREGITLTPLWNNCSGKHAGMLALVRHHGWPSAGYERAGHPLQHRILQEVARWTGVRAEAIPTATEGCTAVTFALPLTAMALAWARFGVDCWYEGYCYLENKILE